MVKNKTIKTDTKQKKGTLDQIHTEHINKFSTMNDLLPIKRNKMLKLKNELSALMQIDPEKYTSDDIHHKSELIDAITNINSEILSIETCSEPLKYIVDTLPILVNYYDNINLIEDGMEEFADVFNESNKKNILNYFMKETNNSTRSNINENIIKTNNTMSKAQLYNDYLNVTDISYKKKQIKKPNTCSLPAPISGTETLVGTNIPICGGNILISDGNLVCEKCGTYEPFYTQHSKPNYKEPLQDSSTYAYKRINHLTEILSQLQAKESTDIPPKVFESIYKEIKKRKIDKYDLDIFKLRRILKNLHFRKYYEHVPHILQIINGKEPPNFSRSDEAKIKKMFNDIQKPFALFCPKNRKNFLNYSYILHKFCELLDLDDYVSYFPLLKNNTKLLQHDKIWKNICGHMLWKYYRSM